MAHQVLKVSNYVYLSMMILASILFIKLNKFIIILKASQILIQK